MLIHSFPRWPQWATRTSQEPGLKQKAYALLYRMLQQQAALLSYVDVFHIMGILFLVIIPLVVLMQRPQRQAAAH